MATALLIGMPVRAETSAVDPLWPSCGENKVSGVNKFMLGPKAAQALTPKAIPEIAMQRCTLALDDPGMNAAPWQRRVSLLRWRARHAIAAYQPEAAMADLEVIKSIEQPDLVYARSMGVSLLMIRALALVEMKRPEEAAVPAIEAANLRPWSERTAAFALLIAELHPAISPIEQKLWTQYVRLNPVARQRRALRLAANGDWNGALADWKRVTPPPGGISDTFVQVANVKVRGMPGVPVRSVDIPRTGQAALAAAMAGEAGTARQWIAAARNVIASPPAPGPTQRVIGVNADPAIQNAELDTWEQIVTAAIEYRSGNANMAGSRLTAMKEAPLTPVILAMFQEISDALPAAQRSDMLRDVPATKAKYAAYQEEQRTWVADIERLLLELPDHEDTTPNNRYGSKVMFLRASGFKETPKKDGSGLTINYFGTKSTPLAVGEMALLRAAELAENKGLSAFLITDRSDFKQLMTPTMWGMPSGPTVTSGYGSNIDVVLVDPAALPSSLAGVDDQLIDTASIKAALVPIYLQGQEKPKR